MSVFKEFKDFIMRGNVLDLAVGIVIGAAFGKIVTSFVTDMMMPPIGLLVGGVDFSSLKLTIKAGPPAVTLNYGMFINTTIDFLIVAGAVFLLIKSVNAFMKKEAPPVTTKDCPECKMPIPLAAKRCAHCTSVVPA
ncbi:MAG TPA: large-conductance mechanosensitive channel protein MscL [Bacteroidota bacterium]|nr:large-conductance mechanosensitive channel protein MscL [Bacteroidota bacterium]